MKMKPPPPPAKRRRCNRLKARRQKEKTMRRSSFDGENIHRYVKAADEN